MNRYRSACVLGLLVAIVASGAGQAAEPTDATRAMLREIGAKRGLCVVLGDPQGKLALDLAGASELTIYVQCAKTAEVTAARRTAEAAGLLGSRIFVDHGDGKEIHLASDLADAVVVTESAAGELVLEEELLRVLRPGGMALLNVGARESRAKRIVKPSPEGGDAWGHPYHGPDNNPQSADRIARGPYLTHFMAEPYYASMPQMTVIAGGRMFKAFGNRTSARPQWPVINSLLAMSAYNGTVLWKRQLSPQFMIHRNTLMATEDAVYLADDTSCKVIDAASGEVRDEITAPKDLVDGPVWKWMALDDGILYALIGEAEPKIETVRGSRFRGAGWPWWAIKDYQFGFGRTVLAINPKTKKVLWHYRDEHPLDSRAMCMAAGRLFIYSHGKFLAALDTKTGRPQWKTTDAKVLTAIGEHDAAQHWMKGFASSVYAKCSEKGIYFSGPTRKNIVGVSAIDGRLLWQRTGGNSQLVLREDGVFALGEGRINSVNSSFKLHPISGKVLATFPSRDRCTRATACADAIFTRGGKGGGTAVFHVDSKEPKMSLIGPMRPACQDGVVIAHGHFFWGPWMCRCDGTQVGVISLGSGAGFEYGAEATEAERLQLAVDDVKVQPLAINAADWPTYRRDNACSARSASKVPSAVRERWMFTPPGTPVATAPIAVGDMVLVSGSDGVVRALDSSTGKPRWTAYTGGGVKYPPTIAAGRAYVGSGDGWLYCYEAATGRAMWRFRAAPAQRKIPVFGSLQSTWPVGSGVLVEDGVAYAAAGMANYDGTHVYALDAVTGKIRWQNNASGHLNNESSESGAGVQSHLLLHGGSIYMSGGSLVPMASYRTKDGEFSRRGAGRGKDLFIHRGQVHGSGYQLYARQDDLHYITAAGLPAPGKNRHIGITEGRPGAKAQIALVQDGAAGDKPNEKAKSLWIARPFEEFAAVAVAQNAVIVAGVDRQELGEKVETSSAVCALNLDDGTILWKHDLPAPAVSWGVAIDREGQVVVTMQDGRVVCLGGE